MNGTDEDTTLEPPDRATAECLSAKLTHRARNVRCHAADPTGQARERLYGRMFPHSYCLGADADGDPDLLS